MVREIPAESLKYSSSINLREPQELDSCFNEFYVIMEILNDEKPFLL